jgi:hypothetical protein
MLHFLQIVSNPENFVVREFVKYNLPKIPKGLNVNNRRCNLRTTTKSVSNSEGVEC